MTQDERRQVGKILAATAFYYDRQLSPEALSMMVSDLDELTFDDACSVLQRYRKDPKNRQFPLPAQLIGMAKPKVEPDSAAREIAARITGAVTKFGWCNALDARNFIGEAGWAIVEMQGGWMHLCENIGRKIDPTTFSAQIRELAKTKLTHSPESLELAIGIAPRNQCAQLESLATDLVKQLEEKSGAVR